jgi:hypothetical protein
VVQGGWQMTKKSSSRPFYSSEFTLVFVLILALLVTIGLIFIFSSGTDRKDLLAIILGAFGAWIGAGAAYFFGRENMDSATESMLKMRMTPQDILANTSLRCLKYRSIPQTFKADTKISAVVEWLKEDPDRFFALILSDTGQVDKALHIEAISRYLIREGNADTDIEKPLSEVVKHIEEKLNAVKGTDAAQSWESLINAAVVLEDWRSASMANNLMEKEKRRITIVIDEKRKPVGYITSGTIRRLMLQTTD